MESLNHFSIPIQGLKDGVHSFEFEIDTAFFGLFADSPIQEAQFKIDLSFDKRPDMIILDFQINGTVATECDRCLADINLPVLDEQQLIFKYGLVEKEEAEVVYIYRETCELNVAKYIYEYICLTIPMTKFCEDTETQACNAEVVKYLNKEDDSAPKNNPIWDQLKNISDQ